MRPKVPAAAHTMRVLTMLARSSAGLPAAHLAAELGVPRSSMYQLLAEMSAQHYVTHLPDEHRYLLGPAAWELGSAYAYQEPLARIGRRVIEGLVDEVGHNCHLAVPDGREVLYVVEERAPGRPSLVSGVGIRLPALITASGRALLATLSGAQVRALYPRSARRSLELTEGEITVLLARTRELGYGFELDDVSPGLASLAVPVINRHGVAVAAVAITYPTMQGGADIDAETYARELLPELSGAAREIERRLGAQAG